MPCPASLRLAVITLLLPLALCGDLTAGGPVLDLGGSTWQLPEVTNRAKAKVKVKSGGKAKVKSVESMSITLGEGETWSGQLGDDVQVSGTYTRKNESSRVLDLTLDQASIDAIEAYQEALAEADLAAQGLFVEVTLGVIESKLRAKIHTQKKAGTATLKLKARFVFDGSVKLPPDSNQIVLKARAKMRGTSLPNELGGQVAN